MLVMVRVAAMTRVVATMTMTMTIRLLHPLTQTPKVR
jgi:hypothetical protein